MTNIKFSQEEVDELKAILKERIATKKDSEGKAIWEGLNIGIGLFRTEFGTFPNMLWLPQKTMDTLEEYLDYSLTTKKETRDSTLHRIQASGGSLRVVVDDGLAQDTMRLGRTSTYNIKGAP